MRSEAMEDARVLGDASAGSRLRASVQRTEVLGSANVIHFDIDAPRVGGEYTDLLERPTGPQR